MGSESPSKNHPGNFKIILYFRFTSRDNGKDNVISISRNNDETVRLDVSQSMIRFHGRNQYIDYLVVEIFLSTKDPTLTGFLDLFHGGIGQGLLEGYYTKQLNSFFFQALLSYGFYFIVFSRENLIDNHAQHFNPFLIKKSFIYDNFINGSANSSNGYEKNF